MTLFLDANILVSVLNKEYPLFTYSSRIVSLSDSKKYTLFTSPICLAIAFYFSEKKSGAEHAKRKIEILTSKIKVVSSDEQAVRSTLKNKKILDFEDGLEYYAALKSSCDYIITEDIGDFYFSEIPVVTSLAFFKSHMSKC